MVFCGWDLLKVVGELSRTSPSSASLHSPCRAQISSSGDTDILLMRLLLLRNTSPTVWDNLRPHTLPPSESHGRQDALSLLCFCNGLDRLHISEYKGLLSVFIPPSLTIEQKKIVFLSFFFPKYFLNVYDMLGFGRALNVQR